METGRSKTSLTEIQESIEIVGLSYSSCPFLGTENDRITALAYAHPANRCYKNQVGMTRQLQYQRAFCLSDRYEECAIFQQEEPSAVKTDAQDRRKRSFGSKLTLTLIIVLLILTAFISLLLLGMNIQNADAAQLPIGTAIIGSNMPDLPQVNTPPAIRLDQVEAGLQHLLKPLFDKLLQIRS